jgi:hypothetical protein
MFTAGIQKDIQKRMTTMLRAIFYVRDVNMMLNYKLKLIICSDRGDT